ncbi:MAG: multidrug transporter ATP-binding protein, partial [Firmicutes bacterium]|nr:multidrug transporter ATP-binding protein [Bacillota bacterium]
MIRLFRHLKPFATMLAAVLVLLFLGALAELYLPTLMSDIINQGVVKGDTAYIWKVGGYMLLIAAGGAVTAIASTYFSARIAVGLGRDLRNRVFTRVESYSLHEFDKIGTATLITRTTNDITQIQTVVVMILRMMVSAPMMVIGGLIMAFSKDATLSLVLVVAIPLIAGAIALIASKGIPLFSVLQVKL